MQRSETQLVGVVGQRSTEQTRSGAVPERKRNQSNPGARVSDFSPAVDVVVFTCTIGRLDSRVVGVL